MISISTSSIKKIVNDFQHFITSGFYRLLFSHKPIQRSSRHWNIKYGHTCSNSKFMKRQNGGSENSNRMRANSRPLTT
ncbi:hypothetical protein SUGI_0020180 [Cryptomeria japonica]|nr:hypothetical protein SUGI_0020180 [Cryptomeria japonica]